MTEIRKVVSVRDAIHRFIRLDRFEFINEIVSTPEFQRLRHITQLGMSPWVYPSATHSRLSHSLGAMRVMEETIDHFHRIGDVKNDEFEDLMKTALAAALLHDIGHGPLSHSSELYFPGFEHEAVSAQIITRPPISDILEKGDIEPSRIVEILKHTAKGRDAMLSQLTSSELDVDRLDYLSRDSYFTGVGFGNVDLDRITSMLRIFEGEGLLKNHAITLYKGRFAVESYLVGRHLMYQAVYFHKATRGVERLVLSALRRAVDIKSEGLIPKRLRFLESTATPSVDEVLAMDDHTIFNALREWQSADDPVLSNLCKRILQRNLLKAIELTPENYRAYHGGVSEKLERVAQKHNIDPKYLCPIDSASETRYTPYRFKPPDDKTSVETSVFVFDEDENPAEISQASEIVRVLSGKQYLDRLYVPEEIKHETERLFKQK